MWKLHDFMCQVCGKEFEELVDSKATETACSCGAVGHKVLSSPPLATYSMASPQEKRRILAKRSSEHTAKLKAGKIAP